MNWTGGTLQRLKAGRQNGVLQKQKVHFAKVRARLQSTPNSPAPPFRPSYLKDDDLNLGSRLSSFGSGNVRHVGHSRRRLQDRRDREESHTESNIRHRQGTDTHHAVEGTSSRRKSHYESASPAGSDDPKRKRKAAYADPEDQLLEAKRMRLLQRQDWVGLAASRPVNMHFSSSKEKDKIGKRRKVGGRPGGHQKSSKPPKGETFHHTEGNHPRPYMSGALPMRRDEDIRIRIGTDASTTGISMQHSDHAQLQTAAPSRTPSDPMFDTMLFDNEHLYAAPEESVQHARVASPKHNMSMGLSTGLHTVSPHASFGGECALEQSRTHRKHSRTSYGRREVGTTKMGSNQQTFGEDPTLYITHHVGGVERYLRLVFDQPSDTLHAGGATDTANAGLMAYERRKVDQNNRDHRTSDAGCARPPSIVDDGRGKSFLTVPDNNSCSTMEERPGSGMSRSPQLQRMTTIVEVEFAEVSQHATIGDQTRISTSPPVSASLPSIKSNRQSEQRALKDRDQDRVAKRIKKREEWQSFVLEGGNDLESDTMHGESSIEMCSIRRSPGLLPLALATASRTSDNVQEAAHRKPRSAPSGCISSPEAPEMYAQELSEADKRAGRPRSAEHDIYSEEELLSQASIINVSRNMDTTLSRNGSGRSCGSDFGPALAKRSESGLLMHESPMYYIPQSDSEGIDLVDAERLW